MVVKDIAGQRFTLIGRAGATLLLTLLAACGGGGTAGPAPALCSGVPATSLAVGQAALVDAATAACLTLPAAGAGGAEHLVALVAGQGVQSTGGVATPFALTGGAGAAAATSAPAARAAAPDLAGRFHLALRERERSAAAGRVPTPGPRYLVAPPAPGSSRTFQVCANTACSSFTPVAATARFVGAHGAIYLDDTVPAGGLAQADIDSLGALFDQYLYPLDTTAFGRESDLDGNGVVAVLLTDQVNVLSGDCRDGAIVGYFFGLDLLPGQPGANAGEVFYSRVPDPSVPSCGATRDRVLRALPPTFMHEFQHMISFNQHVLVRGGDAENTWLNEGLSHFAEELGGRLIPDGPVQGGAASRASQFQANDILNALDYLLDPAASFLVVPGTSLGTTAERGAAWLFVRWLADHYGGPDVAGTPLTRALVATADLGAANVSARAGRPFAELVGLWQLANYLDGLPGFTPADDRLAYRSLDLRSLFLPVYPVFPLRPDSTGGRGYARTGTLRGGSAVHLRIVQPAAAGAVALQAAPGGAAGAWALASPLLAVVRVR